jgi:hypothetical protein
MLAATFASFLFVAPALAASAADWQKRSIYQVRLFGLQKATGFLTSFGVSW